MVAIARDRWDLKRYADGERLGLGVVIQMGIKAWRTEEVDGAGGVDDVNGVERWIGTEPHPSAPSALPPSPEGEGFGRGEVGREGRGWMERL